MRAATNVGTDRQPTRDHEVIRDPATYQHLLKLINRIIDEHWKKLVDPEEICCYARTEDRCIRLIWSFEYISWIVEKTKSIWRPAC